MTEPTVRPGANAESSPLNLRAPHDVIARLARVASKLPPGLFSKHKLAVIALEHGLAVIERDPSILLRGPASASAAASPEAPVAPVAPAAPAPEARAERVERAPRVVPVVASAPVVDPRQLAIPGAVAILAPPSEPAAAPRRARAKAVATPENDALRARYTAALAAKRLTNKPTAARVGCSEGTLHQWQAGTIKNLGGDKDPDGKWLAALTVILDALPPPLG